MSRMVKYEGDIEGQFLDTVTGEILSPARAHIRDIEVIREELLAESDRREWCREYESFVNRVNEILCYKLAERELTYEFVQSFVVEIRIPISVASGELVRDTSAYTQADIGRHPTQFEIRKLIRETSSDDANTVTIQRLDTNVYEL